MIRVDANLLLYAANLAAPEHERARAWLDDRLNGTVAVGLRNGVSLAEVLHEGSSHGFFTTVLTEVLHGGSSRGFFTVIDDGSHERFVTAAAEKPGGTTVNEPSRERP